MKSNLKGGVTVSVVTTGAAPTHASGDKPGPDVLLTPGPGLTNGKISISIASDSDLEPDFKVAQYLRSGSVESHSGESFDEPKMHGQSALPARILPAVPPASVSPHLPDKMNYTLREYSFFDAV